MTAKHTASLIVGLLLMLPSLAQADSRAAYQFMENAKLAGRALACRDPAAKASMTSASRNLVPYLGNAYSGEQHMAEFEKKADISQRFAERANIGRKKCAANLKSIEDNLQRTRRIALDLEFAAPTPAPE